MLDSYITEINALADRYRVTAFVLEARVSVEFRTSPIRPTYALRRLADLLPE